MPEAVRSAPRAGRLATATHIHRLSAHERVLDNGVIRRAAAAAGLITGGLSYVAGRDLTAWSVLTTVHRSAFSPAASRLVERFVSARMIGSTRDDNIRTRRMLDAHVERASQDSQLQRFVAQPRSLLGTRAIVLKSPAARERGVLLLDYFPIFPLFRRLFDLDKIAERYHLVLEPSWSGYCSLDLLCYGALRRPVFIESNEPRDTAFLQTSGTDFVDVPLGANCWVDHRVFRPLPGVTKDADLIMVAGWADYKRHWAFFRALRTLRRNGRRLRVILVGYPLGRTRDDIGRAADYFGILDQLEMYEGITPEEVNLLLNRSKVHVLWSRKEGVNRAIIEAMFAGTPSVVRSGFNFGHPYAHINAETGAFATEDTLPEVLLRLIDANDRLSPRQWVMSHMSPQRSTTTLNDVVRTRALADGECWTTDLVVKTSLVNRMKYWNPEDAARFEPDYRFLMSLVRQ